MHFISDKHADVTGVTNMREKVYHFMQGRYGMDAFSGFLIGTGLMPFLPFSVPLSLCFHSIQSSALYPYNAVTGVENDTPS